MPEKERVEQMVRRVVYRTLGRADDLRPTPARPLVTEAEVNRVPFGGQVEVPAGALVTPLARQVAMDRKVTMLENPSLDTADLGSRTSGMAAPTRTELPSWAAGKSVALAADHGGYALKQELAQLLAQLGYQVVDCGTDSSASVDYPDFALAAAQLVSQGRAWRAIILDGAGIGSCMAANKVPGVRAAMCYDQASALNSRQHNDANVLTLGAGLIGANLAGQIAKVWLETPFEGGRHARRVEKIMEIQRRYAR